MSKNKTAEDFEKIKIEREKVVSEITKRNKEFPKYITQILNIANQNAQATRPKVVGQLSELIKEADVNSYKEWKKWYLSRYPDATEKATDKLWEMVKKMKSAMSEIDKEMVESWVEDLVIDKTVEGLIMQEAVLKELANRYDKDYSLADEKEESKGIDGYVGDIPISIKSDTYLSKSQTLSEKIDIEIVYYKTTNQYLYIYLDKNSEFKQNEK